MTAPTTLLAMARANLAPSRLAEAVLLLVDCQNEYLEGPLALPGAGPAVAEAAALLERARAAGTPVVHVVHQGVPGSLFDLDAPRGAIIDAVAPHPGEPVVRKRLPNAFAGTELDEALKATGRQEVIVVGFMTHMCVSATTRAALDHGWRASVVAAACATRPLPDALGTGPAVDAETLHRVELAALADRFAIVVANQEMVPA